MILLILTLDSEIDMATLMELMKIGEHYTQDSTLKSILST